ncbi:MAG: hypothetical protein H7Z16_18245 [Pyrinomonadaceae bacterium]|nr:hypothetical protein [Pyrinomonadaceae bacterium]
MRTLAGKWIVAAILLVAAVTTSLADIRIKRRLTVKDQRYETTTYIKGARQRDETRQESRAKGKHLEVAFVEQCDLKQFLWIDLSNKRFAVQPGGTPAAAVMAFNEPQLPGDPQRNHRAAVRARKKGLLSGTTTVIDTGERREMFGFVARHLKTTTVWIANPKACDGSGLTSQTDGWYVDLFYGIDCSADLSGSINHTHMAGSGKCFSEYAVKRGYWLEHKRIGPASLGYPLLETRTSYDDKGQPQVATEEALELSTAALDAALFDVPAGFTRVNFKTDNPSFFRRLFSFIGQ